jgi:hypothetical protein
LISCLCHFLLTLNTTSVLAQSADLKSKVDGVVVDLRAAPALNADLKKSLIDLRSAIDVLEAKAPADIAADMAAFLNRAEEIAPIAERLAKEPTKITPVLAAKASELIVAAQKIDVIDPTNAAIHRAAALTEALKSSSIIKTYPALSDAISALFGGLETVEEADFLKAVSRRATSLTTLLTGAGTVPPTSIKAMQDVASLEAAILAYRKHGDPKVDIVFAEYGDLRDRNSRNKRRQVCDATAAMRKLCQGHTSCTLPATPGTTLCPEDPAEFVSAANRAWIIFRCVDSLLNVYPPPALPGMVAGQGNSFWVTLRSSNEEFVCVPPRLNN